MEPPAHIEPFWSAFLEEADRAPDTPLYDVCHFADNEESADALVAPVLRGTKRATASRLWQYEAPGRRPPRPGDLSVVTDWRGAPQCVIETCAVELRAFEDVNAEFAAAEAEGDGTLAYWRDAHWAYFGRVCAALGRAPSLGMQVVCEHFRVVFTGPAR